jgi:pyridoxamine 5'-phosphate oxidase
VDPLTLLAADRQLARERQDPCANLCTLANVDADGLPQARTLVLRDLDERLAIFVNRTSPKFPFLQNDAVSIVVWLPTCNVQYRLACRTEAVPHAMVAESWHLRPEPPKRMDWLYARVQGQSTPIESREGLLAMLEALDLPDPLEAPDVASGFFLTPSMVERLDLGQENGVHDRRRYSLGNPGWYEEVLIP